MKITYFELTSIKILIFFSALYEFQEIGTILRWAFEIINGHGTYYAMRCKLQNVCMRMY